MKQSIQFQDILALKEDYEIEFKKALGKSGKGKLPQDMLETYSAMANNSGGNIFLGIEEYEGGIRLSGISDIASLKKELFDTLNNKQKISLNILNDENVVTHTFDEGAVLQIIVPQATRTQKPIYKGQNPLQGTFIRRHEGDYKCDEVDVNRMLAEKMEESRDTKVLKHYDLEDIDLSTFYAYRNIFKSHKPDHPWSAQSDIDFLKSIGGYRKDRESGEVGLSIAGLLMFGKSTAIEEFFPFYNLDYQERPRARTELRWIDRVQVDGTWSGNIFDFYRIVIKKLFADLKVPFKLNQDQRVDDTPVHEAIRESFINALVHADYTGHSSILVVKRPDMFGFRNPGLMRIPIDIAIKGGESDCRNRTIQKMFTLIGYSERAGSGIPKIYSGWDSQNWRKPLLYEKQEPAQTLIELRMYNLLDSQIIDELSEFYQDEIEGLNSDEMTILATAYIEEGTNHKRMMELLDKHPADVSGILKKMVDDLLLFSIGSGRGTIYQARGINDQARGINQEARGAKDATKREVFYELDDLNDELKSKISYYRSEIEGKSRAKKELMQKIILDICTLGYFSPELLSHLLGRTKDRTKEYLGELSSKGQLKKLYELPNHPKQAYIKTV